MKTTGNRARTFLLRLMFATAALLAFTFPLQAVERQSTDSIWRAVEDYLQMQFQDEPDVSTEIGHIDSRLQLLQCPVPLEVAPPESSRQLGRTSLQVKCPSRPGWKIYVPVRIRKYEEVLVSRHALPRGTYLQPSDVNLERRDISRLHNGYFTDFEEIRQMVARRNLRQGALLTPALVTPPRLVKRGDIITIMAKTGNLSIRVKGKALMDGHKGDTIRVRNSRSKREIEATVVSSGLVKVNI